jgi:hypothetical protein
MAVAVLKSSFRHWREIGQSRRIRHSRTMRLSFFKGLCAGGLATAAMLGISMRVNFLFGYSLGQTLERAEVFGWVSVISDLWKALGPICFIALFRARRQSGLPAYSTPLRRPSAPRSRIARAAPAIAKPWC